MALKCVLPFSAFILNINLLLSWNIIILHLITCVHSWWNLLCQPHIQNKIHIKKKYKSNKLLYGKQKIVLRITRANNPLLHKILRMWFCTTSLCSLIFNNYWCLGVCSCKKIANGSLWFFLLEQISCLHTVVILYNAPKLLKRKVCNLVS